MDMILYHGNNNALNDKLQTLRKMMEQLKCKANDIDDEMRNEELQARKRRKREVSFWLEQVRGIEKETDRIGREVQEASVFAHQRLSKELDRMMGRVKELLKQGEFPRGLVLDDVEPEGIEFVMEKLEGSTPLKVQDEVWSRLVQGESRIGIYGMGGVGKTSVAMHINNKIVKHKDLFNHAYYVTVSQDTSVYKLQSDISKAVAIKLDSEDEARRAAKLGMALRQREKSLLILDDVWEDIPMEKFGVTAEYDNCKLLITSRGKNVCRKMKCFAIEMQPLSKDEAWALFVNQLGNYELLSTEAKDTARLVAKECGGLPLGIITMGRCMRGVYDEYEWRTVLKHLQNPSSSQHDMENKVFCILEISYNRLYNVKLQQCFLRCALYPEDCMIQRDELINSFISEGLVDESSRQENIDEGHTLLNALEDASLLKCATDIHEKRYVKMHDLVRDMAIKIMSKNGSDMVKAGKGLKKVPGELEWTKDLVRVFLMSNRIQTIGGEICP